MNGAIMIAVYWYSMRRAYTWPPMTLASICGSAISRCSGLARGIHPSGHNSFL